MPKVVERVNTFAVDDEICHRAHKVLAFNRWWMLDCCALPAIREGDRVRLTVHQHKIYGPAEVMDVKHYGHRLEDTHRTLLVVKLTADNESEEE